MSNARDVNKAIIKEQFYLIGKILENAAKAKREYREELKKIAGFSSDYKEEFLEAKRGAARQAFTQKNQALHEDALLQLDKLNKTLFEYHNQLDLSNPALSNALKLIELAGHDLDSESVKKINASFAGDQPALRALQAVYKARGFAYDGGLDSQIYEVEPALEALQEHIKSTFTHSGSLNHLAGKIGRIAALEGLEFETLPDPEGVDEALRTGAGLPNPDY